MKSWAYAMAVAATIATSVLPPAGQAADQHRPVCLAAGESREAIQARKMVPPFRAVAEAIRGNPGESVGIRLCRLNAQMVYDIAVLRHDGHLVHILVDAGTGVLMPARAAQ
jgi:uncharacterized membrane protein YkoI